MSLIEIKHDVYEIAKRVKGLDRNYFIVFNTKTSEFEVHNKASCMSFCISAGKSLDARTLAKLRKTRIENLDKIIKEMDENNAKIEKNATKSAISDANTKFNDYMNYEKYKSKSVIFT